MTTIKFLEWYRDQYHSGDLNESNYRECAFFLEGLSESMSDKQRGNVERCVAVLRGGGNLVHFLLLDARGKE